MEAKAVWFVGPRQVEVDAVDLPSPGDGDALVRTLWSGISAGTELLAYRGEVEPDVPLDEALPTLAGRFRYPFRYGYSCVGVVERAAGGGGPPEGTLVFAFHPHQDRFVAPAAHLVPLVGVDPRTATLLPLVETSLQLALDAGEVLEQRVAVLGLGAVGILTSVLLARGGARVTAADPRAWRRAAAASLGVEAVASEDLAALVDERTDGRGLGLVVEASGNPAALEEGLALLAHEGTVLVASWYGARPVALTLGTHFHRRRLTIRSSQVSSIPAALGHRWTHERRREAAGRLVGDLPLAGLVTHEFPFADAPAAFEAADRGHEGLVHAALRYGTEEDR